MKIIDAHIHYSNVEILQKGAILNPGLEYSAHGLRKECDALGVVAAVAMGLTESSPGSFPDSATLNPMELDLDDSLPGFLFCCPGINPLRLSGTNQQKELDRIEEKLVVKTNKGLKIYAGYYNFSVNDPIYEPVYQLAQQYHVPVVIHSGDTYLKSGLLKYSHPLAVDELAVNHPGINFIISHIGYPWVMDAVAVVYKNENVFADVSGLIEGQKGLLEYADNSDFLNHIKTALTYAGFKKFLFGSDWPIVSMKPYMEFIAKLFPETEHSNLFYQNARSLFNLPKMK